MRGALGDVRAGSHEMTRAAVAGTDRWPRCRRTAADQVAVRELDALRRPGRARGVDQRQHVLGRRAAATAASASKPVARRPRRRRARVVPSGRLAVDRGSRARRSRQAARAPPAPGQVGLLGDDDPRARVVDHVVDLLGRVGRGRSRTACRRPSSTARSPRWNSGRLPSMQRDASRPRCNAEAAQAAGERVDALAQLAPGQRDARRGGPDGDLVGALRGRDAERLGDRRRALRGVAALRLSSVGLMARTYRLTPKPSPREPADVVRQPDDEQEARAGSRRRWPAP